MGSYDTMGMVQIKKHIGVLVLAVIAFLLCGCQKAEPAIAEIPQETIILPRAEETTVPSVRNPVDIFWGKFTTIVTPISDAANTAVRQKELGIYLPEAMSIEAYMQRLQNFFASFAQLENTEETYFEGPLLGATGGTGSVNGVEGDCKFSGLLADGTRITGSIQGDTMRAQWEYAKTKATEETPLPTVQPVTSPGDAEVNNVDIPEVVTWHAMGSAQITLKENDVEAAVWWEDGHGMLLVQGDGLYMKTGAANPVEIGGAPQSWASWAFQGGTFHRYGGEGIQ